MQDLRDPHFDAGRAAQVQVAERVATLSLRLSGPVERSNALRESLVEFLGYEDPSYGDHAQSPPPSPPPPLSSSFDSTQAEPVCTTARRGRYLVGTVEAAVEADEIMRNQADEKACKPPSTAKENYRKAEQRFRDNEDSMEKIRRAASKEVATAGGEIAKAVGDIFDFLDQIGQTVDGFLDTPVADYANTTDAVDLAMERALVALDGKVGTAAAASKRLASASSCTAAALVDASMLATAANMEGQGDTLFFAKLEEGGRVVQCNARVQEAIRAAAAREASGY